MSYLTSQEFAASWPQAGESQLIRSHDSTRSQNTEKKGKSNCKGNVIWLMVLLPYLMTMSTLHLIWQWLFNCTHCLTFVDGERGIPFQHSQLKNKYVSNWILTFNHMHRGSILKYKSHSILKQFNITKTDFKSLE